MQARSNNYPQLCQISAAQWKSSNPDFYRKNRSPDNRHFASTILIHLRSEEAQKGDKNEN